MLKTEVDCGGGGGGEWGILCEACERAPAVVICKADAASLCGACDEEIHSANPLARRHLRVRLAAAEEEEAASWLVLNGNERQSENRGVLLFGGSELEEEDGEEEDQEYLKFVELDEEFKDDGCYGGGDDSVVPVPLDQLHFQHHGYDMFSAEPEFHSFNNNAAFLTGHHSVSVSSMEVGVVPDSTTTTTTVSDMSIISNARPPKGTIDLFSGTAAVPTAATQLSPMDREARVLRYREKKKTRKFEKTIRYASRKAYAETRPRIKGRFAKRTDAQVQLDRKFSGYGILHSF